MAKCVHCKNGFTEPNSVGKPYIRCKSCRNARTTKLKNKTYIHPLTPEE